MSTFRPIIAIMHSCIKLALGAAGVLFAYFAWQEAKSSSPDQMAAAVNTAELVRHATTALEQEEQRLVLQRAMLKLLERLLPEAEQTRFSIERLKTLRRIETVRIEKARREKGIHAAAGKRPWTDPVPAPVTSDNADFDETKKRVYGLN